ncbi:hypothetical protein OSB04_023166 [Centaurea solstitialis]|uniref:Myb/SANT-like domain-containing protein n=1 Tax=Centaurea solstitialis TaxID=347529 RepID=A0AA38SKA9_9ASTR|nr:hypothetical protein OSB04_023166 [Centaurea solstitialis]
MESHGKSSEPKKPRVYWKDDAVKTLLEGCIQEMSATGTQGSSLKMQSWKNIAETLKNTHNFVVNQRQMKNQFDYLRGKYVVFSRLMNKTGNVYNPTTNKFNLTEKEWQAEAKLSRFADKLRNAPLLYPDLCKQVFDGAATSTGSWGSLSNHPNTLRVANVANPSLAVDDENLHTTQVSPVSDRTPPVSDRTPPVSDRTPPVSDQAPPISTQVPSSLTQECYFCSQTRKRKANQPLVREDELALVNIFDKPLEEDDIDACMSKLDRLGWEDSPLYNITLFLFSKGVEYRKIWLRLKDEKCKSWIEFTARQLKLDR